MREDSIASGQQFQVQLHHFDDGLGRTGLLAKHAGEQAEAAERSADAARSTADTARVAIQLSNRPWLAITPTIVQPLTFDALRNGGPMAVMSVGNKVENIGQGVALNIFIWEDVVPMSADPGKTFESLHALQSRNCDARRRLQRQGLRGYVLFPHSSPLLLQSDVGPSMADVNKVAAEAANGLEGKVGFVLLGCVYYRSPLDPANAANHQTRFEYWLAPESGQGVINPYIIPKGVASELRLVQIPDGYSAD